MQVFGLHKSIYRLKRINCPEENISLEAVKLKEQIKKWEKLKIYKVPITEIAKIVGISRANYYRKKKAILLYGLKGIESKSKRPKKVRTSKVPQSTIDVIYNIRVASPTYGKEKIAVILRRDYKILLSVSSVGRVLKKLVESSKIRPSICAIKNKRRRRFKSHAKPWHYNMKPTQIGEMVQVDHMTVTKNGIVCKHFQAWDPITKVIFAEVFANAKSSTAKKFLQQLIGNLPFTIKSIQVDGGSEFMKDFEEECRRRNLPLFVLPPKRPQYNGGVERSNRTFREEFYARPDMLADSIGAIKYELKNALSKYNSYRPHFALKGLTPFEYTNSILEANILSHML